MYMFLLFTDFEGLGNKKKNEEEMANDRAELIKVEIYIRKLQALKLERELGIPPSKFTEGLIENSSENQVEVLSVENLNDSIDFFYDYFVLLAFFAL